MSFFDALGNRPPGLRDLPREDVSSTARVLNGSTRAVFGALCEFANNKKSMWPAWVSRVESGWMAWPSVLTLVSTSGFSERAVQAALTELESKKAIKCVYRSRGGGPRQINGKWQPAKTNAFLITPHLLRGSIDENPAKSATEPRKSSKRTPQNLQENPAGGAPYVFKDVSKDCSNNSPAEAAARTTQPGPEQKHTNGSESPPKNQSAWSELLKLAAHAAMQSSSIERERLFTGPWRTLTPDEQITAAQGIGLRIQSGEYSDPHWTPSLATYLREKRWERPPRPKPHPGKLSKREKGMQDFHRRMEEELAERGISVKPGMDSLSEWQRRRT